MDVKSKVYLNFLRQAILFFLLLIALSYPKILLCQNVALKPTRQSSLEAFNKNNYEQAYTEFKELLAAFSKDPLYRYYSGVCLVKLNRNPSEAEVHLKQAIQSTAIGKSLPPDAFFYLGRAQQMSGKFIDATATYNMFIDQVGKKTSKEYNVVEFIQQCGEKKGKITEEALSQKKAETPDPQAVTASNKPVSKLVEIKDTVPLKPVPSSYDGIIDNALELQIKADSMTGVVSNQKKQLVALPVSEKNSAKLKISENEAAAAAYQKSADQKYTDAHVAGTPVAENLMQKKLIDTLKNKMPPEPVKQTVTSANKDLKTESRADTIRKVSVVKSNTAEVYSVFKVLPQPVTNPKEKIQIDPEVLPGLIYRIQIAVFRNPVAPAYFKGITPVYGFKVAGTDKTTYFAGMFRRSADASKALATVKAKGFKDAFVVAHAGNKPVSADRAALLEKEWGKIPLTGNTENVNTLPADTIPPTLAFRVEVMRVLKPVKEDVIEGMKKMAGTRGLDIQTLSDGKIVYLIGNFITFESAAEYSDLLVRNGYREARVVAWLGKKELPVETARELFDNLK